MDEIKNWFIEAIIGGLGAIIWWFWRHHDRRIELVEKRINDVEINHIPRPEVDRMIERVERDYKADHAAIIDFISVRHDEMHQDISQVGDSVHALYNLLLVERRSASRTRE